MTATAAELGLILGNVSSINPGMFKLTAAMLFSIEASSAVDELRAEVDHLETADPRILVSSAGRLAWEGEAVSEVGKLFAVALWHATIKVSGADKPSEVPASWPAGSPFLTPTPMPDPDDAERRAEDWMESLRPGPPS